MAFDNPLDDRQPETASLAARGKHRVEDPGQSFFLNSWSRIFDLDKNAASCDVPFQAYRPVRGSLA